MSNSIFDGLSVVSLEGTGLIVQQLLDSTLIQNTVTIEDHNVTSTDPSIDPLNSDYASISVIGEDLDFDEDDLFQCGRCKMQFSSLESFMTHKRSQCSYLKVKKDPGRTLPLHSSTSTVDCDSKTTLNQVTSSISSKEDPQVESAEEQDVKYDCPLTSTAPVNGSVDGEYFNLALDGSQVFTLNENLHLSTSENDKIIEAKNESLFAATTTLVPETDNQITAPDPLSEIAAEEMADAESQKMKHVVNGLESSLTELQETKPDISGFPHSLFHDRMAKSMPNKNSIKPLRTKHHCSFCSKAFAKNFDLQQHLRSHTGEKPFQCVVCGRGFAQKSNVKKHMITHKVWPKDVISNTLPKEPIKKVISIPHPEEDPNGEKEPTEEVLVDDSYVCPFCSMVHSSYLELRSHMKRHRDQKVYRCIQKNCDESFDELDAFIDHIQIHEKELQYRCHTCSKVFNSLHSLGYHQFEHSIYPWSKKPGPSYYRCTKCMNKYASVEALDHHLKTTKHHFPCKQCARVFFSERLLRTHLKVHGNMHMFTCTTCSKDFKSEHSLRMHKLIHTGERPFECQVCSSSFNRKDKLKRHMLVHEEKKFKCPFSSSCKREFRRNDKLRLHLTSHIHSNGKKFSSKGSKAGRRRKAQSRWRANRLTAAEGKEDMEKNSEDDPLSIERMDPDSSFSAEEPRSPRRSLRKAVATSEMPRTPGEDCTKTQIKVQRHRRITSTSNQNFTSKEDPLVLRVEENSDGFLEKETQEDFIVSYPSDPSDDQGRLEEEVEIIYIPFSLSQNEFLDQKVSEDEEEEEPLTSPHTTVIKAPPYPSSLADDSTLAIRSVSATLPTTTICDPASLASSSGVAADLVEGSSFFVSSQEEEPHFVSTTQLSPLGTSDVLLPQSNVRLETSAKCMVKQVGVISVKPNNNLEHINVVKVKPDKTNKLNKNITPTSRSKLKLPRRQGSVNMPSPLTSPGQIEDCGVIENNTFEMDKEKESNSIGYPNYLNKKCDVGNTPIHGNRAIILRRKPITDINFASDFACEGNR